VETFEKITSSLVKLSGKMRKHVMGLNKGCQWDRRQLTGASWLLLLLLVLLAMARPADAALRIGDMAPSITLSGVNGASIRILETLKGKVAVLHFWQIGCSSCRLEMPAMDGLYGKYRRKGLEILAINVGQRREVVKTFAAELGVSYPILIDMEGKSTALYGVTDIPRTYVIDRSGVVRYRIFGGATPETLKKLILSLL
jgi:cytochrome c biogenesis protein CcmG, thiol:disulfide interchange protein DsbE